MSDALLPPLEDLIATARVVALPMHVRFRGITVREAMLFEGPMGWTEFSPFVEYDDAEASAWLRAAIDFGWQRAEPACAEIPVNATVPAVDADEVPSVLARYPGCTTAKVKVAEPGGSVDDDVARVAAVRAVLGDSGQIRVDANGLWSVEDAVSALVALAPYGLEYAEQPCATVPELATVRERVMSRGVRIAADESVRKAADPLAVARAGAADLLIVKAQPLGGIHAALAIIQEAGLPCVVSSALDTSVGIAMGAFLAASVSGPETACGLGTAAMFRADVTDEPLRPVDGRIPVRRPQVSGALLHQTAAAPDRRAWWIDRLRRTYALIAS
ncbi:o-succinylbenzoate synthase [Curtobacterium ammoniigenes]|uniref:o-succinylbenzoate synthase n=1 Tax=Curtobacterium ammoniigenes TaxID=395387 RepID=UPI00082A5AE0|nr:o-succinylbenzoate synthase [Curtobacterium ammoniigenes]